VLDDDSLDGAGLAASVADSRVVLFGSLDRARAYAEGPTNRSIELTLGTDDYFEGTISGLQPGSYTVAVEGLIGNEVDYFGQTSGVSVSAGQNSTATISFRSFRPSLTSVPTRTASRRFEVCYSTVSGASGYRVEWANNPSFTGLRSQSASSSCAEIEVTGTGTHYVRVRALHDMSSTPGRPSDHRSVEVVAAAVAVGGSVTSADELDIQAGGSTLDLTVTDDQWAATIGGDNAETEALLSGIVSDGSEANGWNAVVSPGLDFTHVSRMSGTVVRITLPAFVYYVSVAETITVTVPAEALVESMDAIVAQPTFTIALSPRLMVSVTGDGTVTSNTGEIDCPDVDCTASYASGTTVTLTATPAAGWGLQEWTDACTGSGTCEITMVQDTAVGATFVQGNFDLNVTVTGNGSVTSVPAGIDCPGDCAESYLGGTDVTLTATPDPGWLFSGWTGDCSGSNASTIVAMNAAKSCTATFVQEMFELNVSVTGSGNVTSDPAGIDCPGPSCLASYASGTEVTLTATPQPGWTFSQWSVDCGGTSPIVQVAMDAAKTCEAIFVQITYALGVTITGTGGVASNPPGITCPGDCTQSYVSGTEVTLTAAPSVDWIFSHWSGDCSGVSLTAVVTMDADKSCTANFVEEYFPLNVIVSGSGSVTSDPAGISCPDDCGEPFLNGSTVTLTATPDPGWLFGEWEGDCTGFEATVQVTMDAAKTCAATFVRETFPLEVNIVGHPRGAGVVTSVPAGIDCGVDCIEIYDSGTEVTLTATPDDFWSAFSHWSGDCSGTELTTVVNVDAAKSCTATFIQAAGEIVVSAAGAGNVSSEPEGIDCPGASCSAAYPIPTQLGLLATPDPGWLFSSWGGDCSGTDPSILITIDADKFCSATFVSRPEWIGLTPQTTLPDPRGEHTAVYVGATNEMVVFGGVTGGGVRLGDLWYLSNANGTEMSSPAWRQVVPSGVPPAPRNNHTAVYDPGSDRMIVYGGYTWDGMFGELLGDVWILTDVSQGGSEWIQLNPAGRGDPLLARHGHSAVYDPDSNRMIVFGGETSTGLDQFHVWVLTNANGTGGDPSAWIQVSYGCDPFQCVAGPGVLDHAVGYDDVKNLMIVVGGADLDGGWPWDDEWIYYNADDTGSTTYFLPIGLPPPANSRDSHAVTYDRASNILTVYGGNMGIVDPSDDPTFVWRLHNASERGAAAWERIDAFGDPPPSRLTHTAVWDPQSNHMIVFGGLDFANGFPLNDLWVLTKANGQLE
jgi:hypothetical protein